MASLQTKLLYKSTIDRSLAQHYLLQVPAHCTLLPVEELATLPLSELVSRCEADS